MAEPALPDNTLLARGTCRLFPTEENMTKACRSEEASFSDTDPKCLPDTKRGELCFVYMYRPVLGHKQVCHVGANRVLHVAIFWRMPPVK